MGHTTLKTVSAALSLMFFSNFDLFCFVPFVSLRGTTGDNSINDIREGADGDTEFQTVSRALQPSSKSALPSR